MIYSIAIGDDFDSGLMQAIASEPSGDHFFVAKDAAEMQNVYTELADMVQSKSCQVRQQEAPGPGVLVKIRNAANGATMQTTTDAEGKYEFEVYPGTWEFERATVTVDGVTYGTFTEGIGGPARTENPSVAVEAAESYPQDLSLKTENVVCPGSPTPTPTAMITPVLTQTPAPTP
jgi:hypothetical protein